MTTQEDLFTIAAEVVAAHGNAERYAAKARSATGARRESFDADAAKWHEISRHGAHRLRAALRRALDTITPVVPDGESPVATPIRGVVEIRGTWNGELRLVRLHCTPTQALAIAAAFTACATVETHPGDQPSRAVPHSIRPSTPPPNQTTPTEITSTGQCRQP